MLDDQAPDEGPLLEWKLKGGRRHAHLVHLRFRRDFDVQVAVADKSKRKVAAGFIEIPSAALPLLGRQTCNLFAPFPGQVAPTLLHSKSIPLGTEQIAQIMRHDLATLLVREDDLGVLSGLLWSAAETIIDAPGMTPAEHLYLLQVGAWQVLEQNRHRRCASQFIDIAQAVGKQIARSFCKNPATSIDLFRGVFRRESHAAELTRIAAYTVLLAQKFGIVDQRTLESIGEGAMLHQIGKLFLPHDDRDASGRLDQRTREQLERYPTVGYEQLCERPDLEQGQLMMVYQHREHADGSGYPVGIDQSEIHPWAKILAVTAAFDARTSGAYYRRRNCLADALAYMTDRAYRHFDPKAVLCWISTFQRA